MPSKPISKGNGTWLLRVSCGYVNGKKKMINKTIHLTPSMTEGAQLKEAMKRAAALEESYEAGKIVSGKQITVKELSVRFMEDYAKRKGLAEKTLAVYQQLLDSRILPAVGNSKIREIKPITLNRFYSEMAKEQPKGWTKEGKLSGTTLLKYHRILYTMFECAVRWQLLAANPAASVTPPSQDTKETEIYTSEQSLALLEALNKADVQWRTLVILALFTQMRRGELIALDWPDIDLQTGEIMIEKSASYVPKQGVIIKEPKTKSGKRKIVLSGYALSALKELRRNQAEQRLKLGELWEDSGAVFAGWDGQRLHVDSPTKWFKKFLERNNLPHIRFHALRHTGASLLISQGMNIEEVKRQLGHSRASTTLDIYGHAFEEFNSRPAEIMDSLLGGQNRQKKRVVHQIVYYRCEISIITCKTKTPKALRYRGFHLARPTGFEPVTF